MSDNTNIPHSGPHWQHIGGSYAAHEQACRDFQMDTRQFLHELSLASTNDVLETCAAVSETALEAHPYALPIFRHIANEATQCSQENKQKLDQARLLTRVVRTPGAPGTAIRSYWLGVVAPQTNLPPAANPQRLLQLAGRLEEQSYRLWHAELFHDYTNALTASIAELQDMQSQLIAEIQQRTTHIQPDSHQSQIKAAS